MIYSWYQAHWQALLLLQAALGTWVFAYGLKRRPHFIRRAAFSLAAMAVGERFYTNQCRTDLYRCAVLWGMLFVGT